MPGLFLCEKGYSKQLTERFDRNIKNCYPWRGIQFSMNGYRVRSFIKIRKF